MNSNTIDIIGEVCWFLMFATPLITIPLVWKYSKHGKLHKIITGLLLAFVLSFIFFIISWGILLRDGLGPT